MATPEQIKEEYAKIISEMDMMETRVLEALVSVYDERVAELQGKCGNETGHAWYDIYYGLNRKCAHCKLVQMVI
jgi:hypothetical protein